MTAELERQCAPHATFDDLTPRQAYGLACVVCGETFADLDSVPVGISPVGGKVFACPPCAAKPVEDGGLGIRPDEDESWTEGQFRFTSCACAPTGPPHQDGCGWAASRPEQGGRA